MNKPLKMMIFSLTSVTLLAACGGTGTQKTTPEGDQPTQTEQQGAEDTGGQEAEQTGDQTEGQNNDQANGQSPEQSQEQNEDSDQSQSQDETGGSEVDPANDQSSTEGTSQGIQDYAFGTNLDDAVQIYRDEVGVQNVSIEGIELDDEDGSYIYEIEGYSENTEYDVDIDAESGDVLEVDTDDEDDDDDVLNLENIITPQEAMQAALEQTGSGYVDEWTLEIDDGAQYYDIDVEDGSDQYIDSETGEILASDQDDDDDDNGDD